MMFYSKESIAEDFNFLQSNLEMMKIVLVEPMPSWKEDKEGSKWTDEYRIRDGHTKLADGSWVTIHKASDWLSVLQKRTEDLYDQHQETSNKLNLALRQKYEMEFGLRHAHKSLNKALEMKGDSND
jgi:hypothetical protein